jgi:riboflavin biosynthesis pyrimidine reductase
VSSTNPNSAEYLSPELPLELLFERANLPAFELPAELSASYGGAFGLPSQCVFANFVASLEGIVALPGDAESGQIISGKKLADRFVMGLLRSCADAVLLGAGTFRKSPGHLWTADRIYPPAAAQFAAVREELGLSPAPKLVLISGSGDLDVTQPAAQNAWIISTPKGESVLRGKLPEGARLSVFDTERIEPMDVLTKLRREGFRRVLSEGGPSLFAGLVRERLIDQLFLTSSPALFGRFPKDDRKALTEGFDLGGAQLDLLSARRQGSHLFLRYALKR